MYYRLQVSNNYEFTDIVVNTIVEAVTDYQIKKDLNYFGVYYWRVKAVNEMTGQESAWSVPCSFRVVAEDVTIHHDVDAKPMGSYIIYGSNEFGMFHKFITEGDIECFIPDAQLGVGLCPTSGIAELGVCYYPGACIPEYTEPQEYILTEDCFILMTEDGLGLLLEF